MRADHVSGNFLCSYMLGYSGDQDTQRAYELTEKMMQRQRGKIYRSGKILVKAKSWECVQSVRGIKRGI